MHIKAQKLPYHLFCMYVNWCWKIFYKEKMYKKRTKNNLAIRSVGCDHNFVPTIITTRSGKASDILANLPTFTFWEFRAFYVQVLAWGYFLDNLHWTLNGSGKSLTSRKLLISLVLSYWTAYEIWGLETLFCHFGSTV